MSNTKDDAYFARKIRQLPYRDRYPLVVLTHEALHVAGWPLTAKAVFDAFFEEEDDWESQRPKQEATP